MKAAVFSEVGGPEVIRFDELPDPIPGPDDVIIQTKAIGLNFADIYRRRGDYTSEPPLPYVLGYEGAGVVVAVGSNVTHIHEGCRVGFAHVPRANAQLVKALAWKVIPLPDDVCDETAAGVLLQGLTAHYLTHDSFKVKTSDTVLVHSASGGVGLLLLQICKMIGARSIGTVSTDSKVNLAESAGANHVIVRSEKWEREVLELTGGKGVDVAYDAIGVTLRETISVTKTQGTVVYYGQAGGPPPAIDPNLLMADSKVLVGAELWSHIANKEALAQRAEVLLSWISRGYLALSSLTKYPLSRTGEAHMALEGGKTQGKILLIPD